jgi:hypothetical protein
MSIVAALRVSVIETGVQLLVLLGPLAVAVAALNLSSAALMRSALRLLGPRGFLLAFGWLGTAVHELSHALFCLLFGHKIAELKLFDPGAKSGSLGFVRHAYDQRNPYHQLGNLFIAIGPVLVGAAALTAAAVLLLGGGDLGAPFAGDGRALGGGPSAGALARRILESAQALAALVASGGPPGWWRVAAFAYLAIAIGSLMGMSREDLVGALPGLAAAIALLLLVNLVAALVAGATLTPRIWDAALGLATAYAVLVAAVAINLAAAIVLFLVSLLASRERGFR